MKPFETSRVFDAPRERVWAAWTEAEHMKKWWGPKGFKVKQLTLELRPGGRLHYCLLAPDGKEMWGKMAYREIKKPEKLVFMNSFSDANGGTTRHPWSENWPLELVSTITFEALGPKQTKVSIAWLPAPGSTDAELKTFDEGRDSMKMGWGGTMDQLSEFLRGSETQR
jgi:uncharacterized protein YndB with AHSA1/START domain